MTLSTIRVRAVAQVLLEETDHAGEALADEEPVARKLGRIHVQHHHAAGTAAGGTVHLVGIEDAGPCRSRTRTTRNRGSWLRRRDTSRHSRNPGHPGGPATTRDPRRAGAGTSRDARAAGSDQGQEGRFLATSEASTAWERERVVAKCSPPPHPIPSGGTDRTGSDALQGV